MDVGYILLFFSLFVELKSRRCFQGDRGYSYVVHAR